MTDPLELPLKDIHLPAEISWWPPAPGWWILLVGIILLAIAGLLWHRRRQRLKRSAINLARQELVTLQAEYELHRDARRIVSDLSVLLRRLSISAFPRTESASLTGEAWLKFLDSPMDEAAFTEGPGRILIEAPYRPEVGEMELQPLISLCHQWIEKLSDRSQEQSP